MRTLAENGTLDGSYSYHSYARSKSRSLLPCPHLDRPPSLPHPCQGYLDSETTSTPPPLVATRSVKWDGRSGCGVVSLRFECRLGRAESFCGPLLYICEWLRSVVSAGCAPQTVEQVCACHARCDASWKFGYFASHG